MAFLILFHGNEGMPGWDQVKLDAYEATGKEIMRELNMRPKDDLNALEDAAYRLSPIFQKYPDATEVFRAQGCLPYDESILDSYPKFLEEALAATKEADKGDRKRFSSPW
ncbi:MAG: hypothetical protein M5R36_18610 [Deltaproteobacteria bacterium]|nr:hypothetical protein [Deltaproteobacteria bacterium]